MWANNKVNKPHSIAATNGKTITRQGHGSNVLVNLLNYHNHKKLCWSVPVEVFGPQVLYTCDKKIYLLTCFGLKSGNILCCSLGNWIEFESVSLNRKNILNLIELLQWAWYCRSFCFLKDFNLHLRHYPCKLIPYRTFKRQKLNKFGLLETLKWIAGTITSSHKMAST